MLVSRSFFFFKQKTAYEMRISDWSSDVCSSDLASAPGDVDHYVDRLGDQRARRVHGHFENQLLQAQQRTQRGTAVDRGDAAGVARAPHLDEIQRLGAAHLADDDTIRAQEIGRAHV